MNFKSIQKLAIKAFGLGLVFSLSPSTFAQSFSDVPSTHPNAVAIEYLSWIEVLEGYEDSGFKPDWSINRAEFLKVLELSLGITPNPEEYKNCMPDVHEEWFAPYVCFALEEGWIQGYEDGYFYPSQSINTAEALKMVLEVSGLAEDRPVLGSERAWYESYQLLAEDLNLMDEDLDLSQWIKRDESAELLFRTLVVTTVSSKGYSLEKRDQFLEYKDFSGTILNNDLIIPVNIVVLSEEGSQELSIPDYENILERMNLFAMENEEVPVQFELKTVHEWGEIQKSYSFCSLASFYGDDLNKSAQEWADAISECTYLEMADSVAMNLYLADDSTDKAMLDTNEPYLFFNWEDMNDDSTSLKEQILELVPYTEALHMNFELIQALRDRGEWYSFPESELTYHFQDPGPWYDPTKGHTGLDFKMPNNTPINTPVSGVITLVYYYSELGLTVILQDSNGQAHIFAHLNSSAVEMGQIVEVGQIIAYSGGSGTGASDGPHLHYEIISKSPEAGHEHMTRSLWGYTGWSIDPEAFLESLGYR